MSTPAAIASEVDLWANHALDAMMSRVFAQLKPRPPLSPLAWVEKYRRLSSEENPDFVGPFRMDNIPVLRGVLAAAGQRGVKRLVGQKSAQIAWTAGVCCTMMGYYTHWKPCVQVAMFPREKSAKDFDAEKFSPMVRATKVLAKRIRLKSRSDGNSATRKHYPGGLLKFVASNSPADVKSTSAKVRYVEEPDDTNRDVKGQGNSITLLRERGKTIRDSFELIGGTPTAKGASEIEKEMQTTDQRRFMVPCNECGERHEVSHEYMVIPGLNLTPDELAAPDIDERYPARQVYGRSRPEEAYYACPHCGSIWTDQQRIANIKTAAIVPPLYGWEPTVDAVDPGFYLNEFQSCFEGSYVPILAEKYVKALHQLEQGDPTDMIAYWNSTRGIPWEYKGELPEEEELRARAEPYAEWTAPAGALIALLTVDVQHARLAMTCWVFGRGEEMWLAHWGEVYGSTIIPHAGAWLELEAMLVKRVGPLGITACAIDCSDGQTSDASYSFVRKHNRRDRPVIAVKGSSDSEGRVEIWTPPKAIDPNHKATKASKFGVQIHIVGTAKAKDLVLGHSQDGGRVRLEGKGPGRMHWYDSVRADFYEQLLSEIKIPSRLNPKRKIWKARTDRRNEALDCTVYAVYLYRHLKLHLRRPSQWDLDELRLRQPSLLTVAVDAAESSKTDQPEEPLDTVQTPAQAEEPEDSPETSPQTPAMPDLSEQLAAARFKSLMQSRIQQRNGRR